MGVRAGDLLVGKYLVERVIGVGGMGVVVAARHLELEGKVAIKLALPQTLYSADAVNLFVQEARAAARIKCDHVARVSDIGYLDDGRPFMVMEYLEGIDLAAWLSQSGLRCP